MKYWTYEKEQIVSALIYCNLNGNETAEDIAKAITTDYFMGKFVASEHVSIVAPIKNDNDMFILRDRYGCINIWQVCGKVTDYTDAIIPHLYRVRQIGIMFD